MSTTPAAPLAGRPAAEQYLARILPHIPDDVRQRPGSADDSEERRRYSSAHCEIVMSGGGASTEKIRVNRSTVAFFIVCHPFPEC